MSTQTYTHLVVTVEHAEPSILTFDSLEKLENVLHDFEYGDSAMIRFTCEQGLFVVPRHRVPGMFAVAA